MIGVYGAGRWGTALEFAISQNHRTLISSRTKRKAINFVKIDKLKKCEYLVVAISSQHIKDWVRKFKYNDQKVLIASKGIDVQEGKFLNEILEEYIPKQNLAYISGPSFATEVIQKLPTAIVINSANIELAKEFSFFFPNYMKTYTSNDVIGAEVAGAYKNILAIASGICDGLMLGNNARASLIARGLVEMSRFGKFFGAHEDTFLGLSGAGDLFLTATSILSRNYRVGIGLSKGKKIEYILAELGEVAEGIDTTKAISELSKKHQIYTPIAHELNLILDGKNVRDSITELLSKR
jgi:glycerol-3-phosphate dehydrogenase (NAD(P)+)